MAVRLSALRAGRPLSPGRFMALDRRAIVRLEELGQLKNSVTLIGNRTRDLHIYTVMAKIIIELEIYTLQLPKHKIATFLKMDSSVFVKIH
jgi:hypothetical protein